ncbi:carboxypeptidase regulatory-like domain-containing protein [candidate division KSB1 bacterium]|nr:carboxypeptidase regulatory-like domain-containing protein [candidate division KSB1 bacterium]
MKIIKLFILSIFVSYLAITLGCGGGGDSTSEDKAPSATKTASMGPAGTATVSGTINFTGEAPRMRPIKHDAECAAFHEERVYPQNVVVNDNNTLKYVFVYVKEGISGSYDPPTEQAVIDQKGCSYHPHVFGVQTGQTIKILNSDPLLHNIHALPKINRSFNFGMPKQGDVRERSFKKAEVMVKIKCDVHPWMSAYCGVVDHPYFSVSGDDGTFTIKNLPAGEYVIEAWQEEYGTSTQSITVGDGESKTVNFAFGKESAN